MQHNRKKVVFVNISATEIKNNSKVSLDRLI